MSLKENIFIWNEAVLLFDSGKYDEAIAKFRQVPEQSAKIVFNIGCLLLLKQNYHKALACFSEAVLKDPYLAVAYFQRGCTNVHLRSYTDAKYDFQSSLEKMRGSETIDYRQLGLSLKLFASQVLMNLALVYNHTGDRNEAVHSVQRASRMVKDSQHETAIVKALGSLPNINVKLMEIPLKDSIFRPPKSAVANLKKKDFLGKATVVSSVAKNDNFVGFEGARKCSSSPNSPSPTKKQNQLTVDDIKVNRGSLTPPPAPSRPPSILPRPANLQSIPKRPPQINGIKSTDIQRSRSSEILTPRSSDISSTMVSELANHLQQMPKRPPPQSNVSRSSGIQRSRSSEILTPMSNNKNSHDSTSSDISRQMEPQPANNYQHMPKRPPPRLNVSRSSDIQRSRSSEILTPRTESIASKSSRTSEVSRRSEVSRTSEVSRPPPPNYPPPVLKKTSEGSKVKVKPPRPPKPVIQKRL